MTNIECRQHAFWPKACCEDHSLTGAEGSRKICLALESQTQIKLGHIMDDNHLFFSEDIIANKMYLE